MKPEIEMAEKMISELSFMLPHSQRNEMEVVLTVAYKHGKADGLKEAILMTAGKLQDIRDAT